MIYITEVQNNYLLELATGPKTTRDFVLSQMVSIHSAGKMIVRLRKAGLVKSQRLRGGRGNVQEHTLITPYQELQKNGISIINRKKECAIPDEEILYAAILRNGLMTGQELKTQFNKTYPDRTKNGISNIVDKARSKGLCR